MTSGKARSAIVVLSMLSLLLPTSAGLGVDGAVFWGTVSPGEKIVHEMTVSIGTNASPLDLEAEVYGFGMSTYTDYLLLDPEEDVSPYSAREFLTIEPKSFQVEPGIPQKVLITGTIPEDIGEGGRYALAAIKSMPNTSGNVGVSTQIQIPILLTIRDTKLVQTGEIIGLNVSENSDGINVDLMFDNTGNYHYKAIADAVLKDEAGTTIAATSPKQSPSSILPTFSCLFKMDLVPESDLSPGTYTVEARVTHENGAVLDTKVATIEV